MLQTLLPDNLQRRKWLVVFYTVLLALLLTLWGIYAIGSYGIALFVLTPIFIGFTATVLFGFGRKIEDKEATSISYITLGIFVACLLVFAIEGIICVAMAAPIGLAMAWVGACFGQVLNHKRFNNGLVSILLLLVVIPSTAFIEREMKPDIQPVVTSVTIDALPETVWQSVVTFPELPEPTQWLFKVGIAYPINATIEGEGVGAVRHCNFNTGSFVEPITTWETARLLQFDVLEQPEPLKELSFWDIDAPHLHDYFVSKRGQFKLIPLKNGQTRLEGTTWYYHNIKPDIYWRLWSNFIIHSIHRRVLDHIKVEAEKSEHKMEEKPSF